MGALLLAAVAGLALAQLALLATAVSVRLAQDLRQRRDREVAAAIRPVFAGYLLGDWPLPAVDPGRSPAVDRVLESLTLELLRKVRGGERSRLVGLLEARGLVDRARRRTRSWSAFRRAHAAELLGAVGDPRLLPDLLRLCRDRVPEVRVAAARAAGKLGNPQAVPLLVGSLSGPRPVPASVVTMALVHLGPSAATHLRPLLGSASAPHRAAAAQVLGVFGDLASTSQLAALVRQDPDDSVRLAAAVALGRIGSPAGVRPLACALAAGHPDALRMAAAASLGRIGGSAAIRALRCCLAGGPLSHQVARVVAEALAQSGPEGEAALERIARGRGPGRPHAQAALAILRLSQERTRELRRLRERTA